MHKLPSLDINHWQATRDALHQYARIIGKLRAGYMPRSKHWWHITLQVCARGLTTTPFPILGQNLELVLDLTRHQLVIESSQGWSAELSLAGQSAASLSTAIIALMRARGLEVDTGLLTAFSDDRELEYDIQAISRFRIATNWIDGVFKGFKGGLREETGPVQIFPHHLDISMNWFSGRLVAGVDPADEEHADEQMNFGFVTGDQTIDNAYFYATAYPVPSGWGELELPGGAYWYRTGWTGAILPYAELVKVNDPQQLLMDYLVKVQAHGAGLMK